MSLDVLPGKDRLSDHSLGLLTDGLLLRGLKNLSSWSSVLSHQLAMPQEDSHGGQPGSQQEY